MSHQQQNVLKGGHLCYALDVELHFLYMKYAGEVSHEE